MKPITVIVDFDRTLFSLGIDWRHLKEEVNELLHKEGRGAIEGSFFHSLYAMCKDRNNASLCVRIQELLDETEGQGLEHGKELPLLHHLPALMKKQKALTVIVMTQNREKVIRDFLKGVWEGKITTFGRRTLKTPPKGSKQALTKLRAYLPSSRGAAVIVIGDGWEDREVARLLNATYLNPTSEAFPKTAIQLWEVLKALANQ